MEIPAHPDSGLVFVACFAEVQVCQLHHLEGAVAELQALFCLCTGWAEQEAGRQPCTAQRPEHLGS